MSEGEREAIGRILYECEKRRGEHAQNVLQRTSGKECCGILMEPWDDCKDTFLSDADAVLAARPASNEVRPSLLHTLQDIAAKRWDENADLDDICDMAESAIKLALAAEPGSSEVRAEYCDLHKSENGWDCAKCNYRWGYRPAHCRRALIPRPAELGESSPDWPPRASASDFPNGHQSYGSTGQLFEVKNGQWVRVREPGESKGDAAPHLNQQLTQED